MAFKALVFSSFRFKVKDFKTDWETLYLYTWPLSLRHGWHKSTHTTLRSGCVNFWQLFPTHLQWSATYADHVTVPVCRSSFCSVSNQVSCLFVVAAADRNWLNPMTQAPACLLILQMSQDLARTVPPVVLRWPFMFRFGVPFHVLPQMRKQCYTPLSLSTHNGHYLLTKTL